ncbi:YeiH family protein [Bacillus sp. REN16]|uniref:YeiH family protein n=1 Tax=Bacillus sp. REN16 TaxID=2887296 RepID=UPI001E3CCAAE|nr:putative sulfate exporter family transporter [Bacillus sp. REN16]MCC3357679.1 putative sulfate exporter family transporter [Bacillus sp. REN16]
MRNANLQVSQTYEKKSFLFNHSLSFRNKLPGVALVFLIGVLANSLGRDFPLIGGAVIAIIIGILVRNFLRIPVGYTEGISYTLKSLLKMAIVLLGFGLSYASIFQLGHEAILLVIIAVLAGILFTFVLAKLFKLDGNIPMLVSLGTAICGATAIVTTSPIIRAKEEETAYAINTIFAFNVLAVLFYPLLGQLFSMSDQIFGMWAGVAIHDTSSVVAAGYSYSSAAGDTSVVIKLIRTLMLVPVTLILSIFISMKSKGTTTNKVKMRKVFPAFILFFAGAVAVNTIFPLPPMLTSVTDGAAKFIILMVMASVGLGTDFKKIQSVGLRPLFVGLLSSVMMGILTLSIILILY